MSCEPIYSPLASPYTAIANPYSKLCAPDTIKALFQNGDFILLQNGDNLIFN